MRPRRLVVLLAGAVLAAGCWAGATGPATDEPEGETAGRDVPRDVTTVVEGVLTACIAETPVVVERVGGAWRGFDVAVLEELATGLGVDLALAATGIDDLVSGAALADGRCDVAAAAVVDDPRLDTTVRTSVGYRTVHRLVVTPSAVAGATPAEVRGRIGVVVGGAATDGVDALAEADVVALPSRADLARALRSGTVDGALVAVGDLPALQTQVDPDLAVWSTVPTERQTVLLLPLAAGDDLVQAVDGALEELRASGRLGALRDAWLPG